MVVSRVGAMVLPLKSERINRTGPTWAGTCTVTFMGMVGATHWRLGTRTDHRASKAVNVCMRGNTAEERGRCGGVTG